MSSSIALLNRLAEHAARMPGRSAFESADGTERLTWQQLLQSTAGFAAALRRDLSPGDILLISAPNCCALPPAFLGALAGGCGALLVSSDTPAAELAALARVAGARAIVASDAVLQSGEFSQFKQYPVQEVVRLAGGDLFAGDDPAATAALLLCSSGSTGTPKIVRRDAHAVDAVSQQMVEAIGVRRDDRILAAAPLTHSYGVEHGLLVPIWVGATAVLAPGLDVSVPMEGITIFPGVPSMFEALAAGPSIFGHLRLAYSAGAPLPPSIAQAFSERHGVRIGQLYGASEIGSVTYGDPAADWYRPNTVGRPMRNVRIVVASESPRQPLPAGTEAQIWIAAASMFSGYLDGTDSGVIDGFFPTGDLGRIDEQGNLHITGRLKLLIDVGGLKVNPLEVERVMMEHPLVGECIVLPIRQSETVCRLKAVILSRDPANPPSPDALRQFARQRLASYKVPRRFELRTELPRTPSGKVLRHLVHA